MDVASVRRVHQEDWTVEGVRFLRARDLVAFAKNEPVDDPLFISEEMYQEYSAQSGKVSMGDLLVTGVGTIGVPWLVTSENPIYFKDGNIIWFKNEGKIDGEFFYHSFTASTIQSFINEAAGIGTVGTFTIETGKKTPIWLPTKQEQRCVSAFMTCLDNLITLHQRKQGNVWLRNGAWNGLTNSLVFRTPLAASSPSCTPTVASMDETDGADKAAAGSVPMAQTFVCAPGDASAAEPSERPFALRGMPLGPGGNRLDCGIMTMRLNIRVSDGELEALDRASAEMGCSRSQVVRLLIHCLADGGARMGGRAPSPSTTRPPTASCATCAP